MLFQSFFSRQLARPSGLFGRLFAARWLDRANVAMNALALGELAPAADDRLLEIGFGGGHLLERALVEHRCGFVAGVDIAPAMVARVARRLRRHIAAGEALIRSGTIDALPFADGEFSALCSVNTLYFWPDPPHALSECHRVLRPGGRLTLCFNDKDEMLRWPGHVHGFALYELGEVQTMLAAAGFSALRTATGNDHRQGRFHCVSAIAA